MQAKKFPVLSSRLVIYKPLWLFGEIRT